MSDASLKLKVVATDAQVEDADLEIHRGAALAVESFERLLNDVPPEAHESVAQAIDRALESRGSPGERGLAARLTDRDYDEVERVELEVAALVERFLRRRELLTGALTTEQVAKLLGTSRQTPHDRLVARTLLAVLDRGALRFPPWQFDPEGPNGVMEGFPEVLRALPVTGFAALSWFVRANPFLENRTPVEAIEAGDKDRVIAAARGVAVT